jgi:hypothetical protein
MCSEARLDSRSGEIIVDGLSIIVQYRSTSAWSTGNQQAQSQYIQVLVRVFLDIAQCGIITDRIHINGLPGDRLVQRLGSNENSFTAW